MIDKEELTDIAMDFMRDYDCPVPTLVYNSFKNGYRSCYKRAETLIQALNDIIQCGPVTQDTPDKLIRLEHRNMRNRAKIALNYFYENK